MILLGNILIDCYDIIENILIFVYKNYAISSVIIEVQNETYTWFI